MGEMQLFVDKYHLDTMLGNRAVHIFNDNAMMHFRKSLQHRHNQLTLGMFLVKRVGKATAEDVESTAGKRQRREKSPRGELPCIIMEGDSHKKSI